MKLTARIKTQPKLTAKIKELKMPLSGGFEEGYEQGYADGYEVGNSEGYAEGRSSLDVLPTLGFTTIGAYYGKPLGSFGNQKLVVLITLKKGKPVPEGSFGTIYQKSGGGTSAAWVVSGGKYNTYSSVYQIVPSDYSWSMLGCYPGNQETWDAFMDALDVRVERVGEEV